MICIECGGNMSKSKKEIEYKFRGEIILVNGISHYKCDLCGEEELDLESAEALQEAAHSEYRKRHGLLEPEEIREIRERYLVSQQEFEQVIGSGKTTVSRWETGAIMQPSVADTLLRVLRDNPQIFALLAQQAGISLSNRSKGVL